MYEVIFTLRIFVVDQLPPSSLPLIGLAMLEEIV